MNRQPSIVIFELGQSWVGLDVWLGVSSTYPRRIKRGNKKQTEEEHTRSRDSTTATEGVGRKELLAFKPRGAAHRSALTFPLAGSLMNGVLVGLGLLRLVVHDAVAGL